MKDSFCKTRTVAAIILLVCFSGFQCARAQIKINEVMVRPGGNQGLIVFNGSSGNEYVELYNPSCTPVNVAGYFIACRQDFAGINSGGAFRIPGVAAATIAPGGHLVLGTATSSADSNSVDIKLPKYTANYCQNTSTANFILANADGWVALYDPSGTPVDAVFWSSAAGNISQTADFGGVPCVPGGSPAGVNLESAQQINSGFPGVLTYGGANPAAGATLSRIPDGGTWQSGITPSVNDLTVGNCNGGTCQTVSSITYLLAVATPLCGSTNGSINVNVTSAGTATYNWSANAATGNNATAANLSSGTYSVTITQNGCTRDTTLTLTSPNGVSVSLTNPVNPSCAGNDGSITINLSGGTAPYQVVIDTGGAPINLTVPFAINQTVGNIPAGTVSVSVTDGAGCTSSANATLTAPANCCSFTISANITASNCGSSNGSIAVTAANGSGNYTYNWSANAATGNSANASNLAAGQYQLTVTDNSFSNCSIDTFFTVTNPNAPVLNNSTIINETCAGTNDGSITLSVSGGTGTLSYTWSANANTGNNSTANNLTSGIYTYTVTDANNCQASGSSTVQSGICCNLQASAAATSTTCGLSNGSISANVIGGGQAPFTYRLNGGTSQPGNTFNNLSAGNYIVVVTDVNGCADTITTAVTGSSNALAINIQAVNINCFGSADGSLAATVTGGSGTLTFSWNNGQTGNSLSNLSPGNYTLTVTDASGCSASASQTITQPSELLLNIGNDTTLCVASLVQFNAPAGFTSYVWSNGSNTATITVSAPGTYALTVTNINGCTATDSVTVSLNSGLSLFIGDDQTIYEGNSIGLFPILNGGGSGQFSWTPENTVSCSNCQNTVATPATTTGYVLTFTDNNGCSISDSILITVQAVGNIFFPSAFSPNGDGNNDRYLAYGSGVKTYRLKVFNRWGEKVFETDNFNDGWNGIYKEKEQPAGAYVYVAEITLLNNATRDFKGSFTLIR